MQQIIKQRTTFFQQEVTPPSTGERNLRPQVLKCKCCGTERPAHDFRTDRRSKTGYALICKACETQKRKNAIAKSGAVVADIRQRSLEDYTPVELMKELRRRGYDGELTVTERKTVRLRDL